MKNHGSTMKTPWKTTFTCVIFSKEKASDFFTQLTDADAIFASEANLFLCQEPKEETPSVHDKRKIGNSNSPGQMPSRHMLCLMCSGLAHPLGYSHYMTKAACMWTPDQQIQQFSSHCCHKYERLQLMSLCTKISS